MSTRTRSKGTAPSFGALPTVCQVSGSFRSPKSGWVYGPGSYGSGNNWSLNTPESRETMVDTIGNRRGHNAVTHDVRRATQASDLQGPVYEYTNTTSPFGVARCQCASALAVTISQGFLLDHEPVPDGTLVARSRVPEFNRRQVDGLVELYELKDIRSSLAQISAHFMGIEYARRVGEYPGDSRRSIVRAIRNEFASSPSAFLSGIANTHLAFKFAVLPLARAVNDVHSAIGRVDRALQRMAKPFAVHGSFVAENDKTYYSNWIVEPSTLGLFQRREFVRRTTKATFTQTALRQIDQTKLPSLDSMKLSAIRESLGLTAGFKTMWDIIPRSFVLDWFFPVRNYLEQADGLKPDGSWYTTLSTYGSVKTVTTGFVLEEFAPLQADGTTVSKNGTETNRAEFYHSTYSRTAISSGSTWGPANIYVPQPRIPKKEQWFTMAEMLFQNSYQAFRVRGRSLGV